MAFVQKQGFDFSFDADACKTCPGRCCRGVSGHVWVNQKEIFQISAFLKIYPIDAVYQYFQPVDNRYAIKERYEGDGFACIFYDETKNNCSIYKVRPFQCRQFPFWEYFKQHMNFLIKECPGVRMNT